MAKKVKKNNHLTFNHPDLRNSFNTLVANIKFASIDKPIKSITVVSPGENEGKTTVATNLALALGVTGKKVIIVDADMRRRSVGDAINIHPKYGIYSVLSGRCPINEGISNTYSKNLFFMDCELNIPNPAVLLSTNSFAKLVDHIYGIFDYVIFDTPPLSTFVDGALVSSLTDATILAFRPNQTKRKDFDKSINQLNAAKANLIGTVTTFSTDASESQYYYAYYNPQGKRVKKNKDNNIKPIMDIDVKSNLATWMNNTNVGIAEQRQKGVAHETFNMVVDNINHEDNDKNKKPAHSSGNAGNN